jgi:peptidoglycan-associated lipoprotein
MKRQNYRFFSLILALLTGLSAFSQDKEIKAGDDYFQDLQYQQAIENYYKAWGKMKEQTLKKQQIEYKLAECYRLVNKPAESARWYGNIADSKLTEKNPDIFLHYADALRSIGNCQKATGYYQKFLEKNPDNPLGIAGKRSCDLFGGTDNTSRYVVENVKNLNSVDDDYAAAFSAKNSDQLFLSSNRKGTTGKDRENWTGAWFSDIYLSNYKNSSWETPVTADATEVLNTESNEGTPVFNKTFGTVYFTRCDKGSDKKVYCRIMESDRQGERWAKPATVLSNESANMGQPWISSDELVIYFASDRQGGQGGKDLWMASRTNKSKPFGEPVNIGQPVNTPGDEMFPYLKNDTLLYFSSNGHPGFGGLDLFKSVKKNNNWTEPENLLQPLNSTGDDFALVFSDDKEGFLSSNRDGGTGGDDIYHFSLKKLIFNLSGTVKDERTLFTMPGVSALLINPAGDTAEVMTNEQGFYSFDSKNLQEDNNYLVVLSRENFFSVRTEIFTNDFTENHDFVVDALLKPIPEDPIILPDILYDLAKWDLKPQYQDSLEILVKILKDNPNLVIELRSHTDSRASAEYNDELSQKRAQTVVDFLVSKGVDPGQLIARGYGERVPRTLERDFIREGYTLKKGIVLTDPFIEKLPSNEIKESAFELNRRTEFMVIAKDYQPSGKTTTDMPVINIINDSLGMVLPYSLSSNNEKLIDCYINDFKSEAQLDNKNNTSFIDEQKVIELMRQGALSKENFEGDAGEILKDNQVQEGAVVRINKLRIGDRSVADVLLTVRKGTASSLSLGRDTLDKIGTFKIDETKKQIIFK